LTFSDEFGIITARLQRLEANINFAPALAREEVKGNDEG
jgi:hypothetical protein